MNPPESKTQSNSSIPFHINLMQRLEGELNERTIAFGTSHPSIAETHNSIALIHHHMRHESKEALRNHIKALVILGEGYRASNESVEQDGSILSISAETKRQKVQIAVSFAVTLSDIGNVYWALGELQKADIAFKDAISVLDTENVQDTHPRKYSILNRLLKLNDNQCHQSAYPTISTSIIDEKDNTHEAAWGSDQSTGSEESNQSRSRKRTFEEILHTYQKSES